MLQRKSLEVKEGTYSATICLSAFSKNMTIAIHTDMLVVELPEQNDLVWCVKNHAAQNGLYAVGGKTFDLEYKNNGCFYLGSDHYKVATILTSEGAIALATYAIWNIKKWHPEIVPGTLFAFEEQLRERHGF